MNDYGILMYRGKVYVSNSSEMKNKMMREMHNVSYVGHLVYQKSITDLRIQQFWTRLKK
jgi:hypothetical protein